MKVAFLILRTGLQDKDSGVEDEEPAADVVEGHVDAELDVAGAILLIYRPTQQQVELGEGCNKIESAVSNGITLGVNEVFKGKVKGQLQVGEILLLLSFSFITIFIQCTLLTSVTMTFLYLYS